MHAATRGCCAVSSAATELHACMNTCVNACGAVRCARDKWNDAVIAIEKNRIAFHLYTMLILPFVRMHAYGVRSGTKLGLTRSGFFDYTRHPQIERIAEYLDLIISTRTPYKY